MAQIRTKKCQKRVFFKYSCIIYHWKAYDNGISTFVKKDMKMNFQTLNGPKWPKKGQKRVKTGFSFHIIESYVVEKLMASQSHGL